MNLDITPVILTYLWCNVFLVFLSFDSIDGLLYFSSLITLVFTIWIITIYGFPPFSLWVLKCLFLGFIIDLLLDIEVIVLMYSILHVLILVFYLIVLLRMLCISYFNLCIPYLYSNALVLCWFTLGLYF